jgi:cytochrome c553
VPVPEASIVATAHPSTRLCPQTRTRAAFDMAMMDVLAEASFAASQQETEAVSILQGLFAARESPEPEDACGGDSADEADGDDAPRPWTRDEDELLRRLTLSKAGPQPSSRRGVAKPPVPALDMRAWREIAEHFEDRTPMQCASRFRKTLSPDNVKGGRPTYPPCASVSFQLSMLSRRARRRFRMLTPPAHR